MTRDHIQMILLLGRLVDQGWGKQGDAYLSVGVEVGGKKHELRGFLIERAPLGLDVVELFSPDGWSILEGAEERLEEAVIELVGAGKQFCTSWNNLKALPVVLWTDCGRVERV